jgi:hypothetical protein
VPKAAAKSSASRCYFLYFAQKTDVIFYTLPRSINTIKTWTHVFKTIQDEVVNFPDDSSDNEKDNLSTKYKIIAQA